MSLDIILDAVRVSRGGATLLDDVSLHLADGAAVALVGGNGAGKTTMLRLLRGDIWPDQLPGGGYAGQRLYVVDGQPQVSPLQARERIGLAGADMRDLYRRRGWNVSGWLIAASGLTDSPLPSGELTPAVRQAALDALERLNAADLAYRPFLELSQGQAMTVLLARAVVRNPGWLFLDEAVDGLDAQARELLGQSLRALNAQGVGLVVATHQAAALPDMNFRLVEMRAGRVVRSGRLQREVAPARRSRASATPVHVSGGDPLIRLEGVEVIRGANTVLRGLDWSLEPGQQWLVVGRNGAGKSSLVKLLSGDLHQSAGRVSRFGLAEPCSLWDLRARMGVVCWDAQAEYPGDTTLRQVLVSGFFGSFGLYGEPTPAQTATAAAWLERLGLAELADRPMATLSQGQARKAMLGRALAFDPPVLLLDEPLGGLDPQARAAMLELLDGLILAGKQLVMVTHNPEESPAGITHAMILENGAVAEQGPVERVLG